MAQRVVVTLSDDIDGGEAAETVAFGLDGKSYEIDLNPANAKKLRKRPRPLRGRPAASSVPESGKTYLPAHLRGPRPGGGARLGPVAQMDVPAARPDPQEGLRGLQRGRVEHRRSASRADPICTTPPLIG